MTMQMLDSFSYRGKRAEAIAISRRFSFAPANIFGIATASWFLQKSMDKLYEDGTFKPLTEEERVTANLIMFSDCLPV